MPKLTWNNVYANFKQTHPHLSKMAWYFCPYDYAEILIYLSDGSKITYNYDTGRVNFNPLLTRNLQAVL